MDIFSICSQLPLRFIPAKHTLTHIAIRPRSAYAHQHNLLGVVQTIRTSFGISIRNYDGVRATAYIRAKVYCWWWLLEP